MNKKAISEMVSYILLISLAVAMSGIVYAWLQFYVQKPFAEESCPDISLIITDYNCSNGIFNLTVQNKGRFYVDGYTLKINNGTRDYSIYEISSIIKSIPIRNYVNASMNPGDINSGQFNFMIYKKINAVEIEAVRGFDKSGRPILCENSVFRQAISNCQYQQ